MKKIPPWLMYVERKTAGFIIKLLIKTIRFQYINRPSADAKCIYSVWHRDVLLITLAFSGSKIAAVISASQDGELIAGPAQELGYTTMRGSSTRMGAKAYRDMLRVAQTMQLGITPDGPKGPVKSVHPGIIHIAYMAKIPIIAVGVQIDKEWVFNSWDRFRVAKPFSKITVCYGDPLMVSDVSDMEAAMASVKAAMDEVESSLPVK